MMEGMILMSENLSYLHGCFTNESSKSTFPALRRAWKLCLENEAVNSLCESKLLNTEQNPRCLQENQFIARYIYIEKMCQSSKVSVFKGDFQ